MKKVIMSVALISAISIAAGYSMIGSEKSDVNVSELTQANVEALAQSAEFGPFCAEVIHKDCGFPDVIAFGIIVEQYD